MQHLQSTVAAHRGTPQKHITLALDTATRKAKLTDLANSEQHIVQGDQGHEGIVCALGTLQPPPVVAHIDVGQVVDELDQHRHHSVQPVPVHLLCYKAGEGARGGVDPSVQDIAGLGDVHLHNACATTQQNCSWVISSYECHDVHCAWTKQQPYMCCSSVMRLRVCMPHTDTRDAVFHKCFLTT